MKKSLWLNILMGLVVIGMCICGYRIVRAYLDLKRNIIIQKTLYEWVKSKEYEKLNRESSRYKAVLYWDRVGYGETNMSKRGKR
jgi:hypothetical protein